MLYTYFDLFTNTQIIYYRGPNDNKGTVVCTCPLDKLDENLVNLTERYKDSDIHLYGNQAYAEGLAEVINTQLITKYSTNKINVYIN